MTAAMARRSIVLCDSSCDENVVVTSVPFRGAASGRFGGSHPTKAARKAMVSTLFGRISLLLRKHPTDSRSQIQTMQLSASSNRLFYVELRPTTVSPDSRPTAPHQPAQISTEISSKSGIFLAPENHHPTHHNPPCKNHKLTTKNHPENITFLPTPFKKHPQIPEKSQDAHPKAPLNFFCRKQV